ncbi:Protein of unknown function, putative, partial [Plasmodium vivax]
FGISLENIYKRDKILNMKFNRLLGRVVQNKEFEHTHLRVKLPDRGIHKNERTVSDDLSTYSRVKRKASNNIDLYMKNYKNRYMRKKGLSRLDCYYENKVFSKFNNICDIGKKMQYDEKRAKKFFLKKYGIGLIFLSLIPAFSLIYFILFGVGENPGIFGLCPVRSDDKSHFESGIGKHKDSPEDIKNCFRRWMYDYEYEINIAGYISMAFSFIMIIIVLSLFFYILIKVIKYEKLKAGKGKMCIKAYCKFCKDI